MKYVFMKITSYCVLFLFIFYITSQFWRAVGVVLTPIHLLPFFVQLICVQKVPFFVHDQLSHEIQLRQAS